ncbi:hypothetical protein [Sphingorhabdus pulchriflava]|nr:hypothetical protein [Sphingorhabdus pulchriflava]
MNHPSPLRHDTDAKLPAAAYLRYESRSDGWSGGRQAAFLAHLADNGVVEDAARSVGMSVSGGYALRRQARGFAFDLGWEAALILARRIVADRLMSAAIRGEEARWVREEGITTYTRQNTRLSMALLDRVNPATAVPEVLAVVVRFDCYLQMLDEGLNGQELWDLFFEEALPASDREARARVRHSLLLSEESAGFDEEEGQEEPPIEYKSMEGPPTSYGKPCKAHFLSSATSAPLRETIFSSRRSRRRPEASRENAEIFDAAPLLSESPLGEVPTESQPTAHPASRLPQPNGYGTCTKGRRRGRATCGVNAIMTKCGAIGLVYALATGALMPTMLSAAELPAPVPMAPPTPPLVCASTTPLPPEIAAIAQAKPKIWRDSIGTLIKGPVLGGTIDCTETFDADASRIITVRSEKFTLQGVKGRIAYLDNSVKIALDGDRMPHVGRPKDGPSDYDCSWPSIGTNSARCISALDPAADMRLIGLAAKEGQVAALEINPSLFAGNSNLLDPEKPVRLYNSAGASMEVRWNMGRLVAIEYIRSAMFEGAPFVSIINGLKPGEYLSVEAYDKGKDKPVIRRAEASAVLGQLNTAFALAEALRKK